MGLQSMSRRNKPLEGITELREACKTRAKFTKVNSQDYFNLLVRYDVAAFSDNMSYNVWEEYHSRRGNVIQVRRLYVEKLLEKHDERDRY